MTQPLYITHPSGEKRPLNPWQVVAWRAAEVPQSDAPGATVYNGTAVILANGQMIGCTETEDVFTRLWTEAINDPMFPERRANPPPRKGTSK